KRLDGMDARFDNVDKRLDGMDTRLDNVDKRLDGMDARFDSVDQRLDDIKEHLSLLESKNAERHLYLKNEIDVMSSDISFIKYKEFKNEEDIFKLKKNIK
ncbi:hypothetical protein GOQ29_05215, partial [Clostridium sp. D2Q-14]